jgi:hypothetical protein
MFLADYFAAAKSFFTNASYDKLTAALALPKTHAG